MYSCELDRMVRHKRPIVYICKMRSDGAGLAVRIRPALRAKWLRNLAYRSSVFLRSCRQVVCVKIIGVPKVVAARQAERAIRAWDGIRRLCISRNSERIAVNRQAGR